MSDRDEYSPVVSMEEENCQSTGTQIFVISMVVYPEMCVTDYSLHDCLSLYLTFRCRRITYHLLGHELPLTGNINRHVIMYLN